MSRQVFLMSWLLLTIQVSLGGCLDWLLGRPLKAARPAKVIETNTTPVKSIEMTKRASGRVSILNPLDSAYAATYDYAMTNDLDITQVCIVGQSGKNIHLSGRQALARIKKFREKTKS